MSDLIPAGYNAEIPAAGNWIGLKNRHPMRLASGHRQADSYTAELQYRGKYGKDCDMKTFIFLRKVICIRIRPKTIADGLQLGSRLRQLQERQLGIVRGGNE